VSAPNIGIFLPSITLAGKVPGDIGAAARQAEDLGLESVWVIDQLVAGTNMAFLDSTVALTAAAAVTERVKLGFGVMVLPLRTAVWVAKQIAALQHLSGDRVILGVGVGEDRHPASWGAAGVHRRERGRRMDAALRVLPDLIAGHVSQGPDGAEFRLMPGATVPPIVVGGITEVALARAADADGWFGVPLPPAEITRLRARLAELAAAKGRPTPTITALVMAACTDDPAVRDREAVVDAVADPADMWGFPREAAEAMVMAGPVAAIAKHLAALGDAGVDRVAVTVAGGAWSHQAELLAEAARLLG
jgi:alkanesulfonate monooxygenase SsuD/methylene tetrahydromethanopterin reductase-like flavin-dependent oxidoreductase (luciferase family)